MDAPTDDPAGLEVALSSGASADILVPCDVAAMGDVATALRAHAAVLEQAGASLARVEVTSWRGRAAEGFTDVLAPEPARWRAAADAFRAGADALDRFMAAIGPARSLAADAIALWQRYLASAGAAAAMAGVPAPPAVSGQLMVGARIAQQHQVAGVGGAAAALATAADTLRRQAVATLAAARGMVRSAGDLSAAALAEATEAAPQARRFWESTIRPAEAITVGHAALDGLGMVPALGAIPDAVNAGWYALKGDGVNAAISATGIVPFFGDAVVGGRLVQSAASQAIKRSSVFPLFRGMRPEGDLGPELGRTAKTLGVRLGTDITPDVAGLVHPHSGGMSAGVDMEGILPLRKPPEFGGTDKNLTMYRLDSDRLGGGLIYVRDHGTHGTIQPLTDVTGGV